jgi:AAA+ ATPase superfamily predicted ATPase
MEGSLEQNRAKIIGRATEQRILEKLRRSSEPEFLAIYGRRRVGKTFLIRNYFGDEDLYFELTGQRDSSLAVQLHNFANAFSDKFIGRHRIAPPASWSEALRALALEVNSRDPVGKVVLFFDELPWLASRRFGFLAALDHFWNTWATRRNNVIVIICGSAASWMIEKVLHHRGGLHNRITERIRLLPFSLNETEAYLLHRGVRLDYKQILEIYMATGGIPHYLRQITPGQSADQNIDRLCFTKDGFLRGEFAQLYPALFDSSDAHIKVVKALAKKRQGLSRGQLLRSAGIESGGRATKILGALLESGFISCTVPLGKRSNDALYHLAVVFPSPEKQQG